MAGAAVVGVGFYSMSTAKATATPPGRVLRVALTGGRMLCSGEGITFLKLKRRSVLQPRGSYIAQDCNVLRSNGRVACGGKSSALKAIQERLEPKGVTVLAVPEIPTILMLGGCKLVSSP